MESTAEDIIGSRGKAAYGLTEKRERKKSNKKKEKDIRSRITQA